VFVADTTTANHFIVLSETHILSGTSLNEFRFAFNRTNPDEISLPTVPIDPSLSFIPGRSFGTIAFNAAVTSATAQLSSLGSNANYPVLWPQNLFEATETYSVVRGAHSLKFGFDLERIQFNGWSATNSNGTYTFGGLLPLLAGQATQFQAYIIGQNSNPERGYRRVFFGGFAQDDYRVRPNLTLNLGLREEFFTSPSEVNGRTANLRNITDPHSTLGPPFETKKINLAPRLGLAWDPTGSGKTSVRLGAGLFFNQIDGHVYEQYSNDARFSASYVINNPPFPNGLANGYSPQLQAENVVQYHLNTPAVIQYNLDVQRQLLPSLSLRLGYIGSYGYHMTSISAEDIRVAQILPDGSRFFASSAPLINPNFSQIAELLADAHMNYNAFQAVLQKTLAAGLRFQFAYTFSKTLSDSDSSSNQQINSTSAGTLDIHNIGRDYGHSAYDQRHIIVANAQYQMPWDKRLNGRLARGFLGGWAVNGIASYGSGLHFDILDGFNNSQNTDKNVPDRPNLTPGGSNNPIEGATAGCSGIPAGQKLGTPNRYYDPCAFQLSPAGTFGNLGRNTVTAPNLFDVDFTWVKSLALTEKKKLEFRAEFFNLLNHANFGVPANSVFNSSRSYNGNAGVITSTATDAREIQLGLKLAF